MSNSCGESKYLNPKERGEKSQSYKTSIVSLKSCLIYLLHLVCHLLNANSCIRASHSRAICRVAFPANATWLQVLIWHQWGKYQLPRSLQLYSTQNEYLTWWQLQTSWYLNVISNTGGCLKETTMVSRTRRHIDEKESCWRWALVYRWWGPNSSLKLGLITFRISILKEEHVNVQLKIERDVFRLTYTAKNGGGALHYFH